MPDTDKGGFDALSDIEQGAHKPTAHQIRETAKEERRWERIESKYLRTDVNPENILSIKQQLLAVTEFLASQTPEVRQVVDLQMDGLTYRQIGERTGKSTNKVRMIYRRYLGRLDKAHGDIKADLNIVRNRPARKKPSKAMKDQAWIHRGFDIKINYNPYTDIVPEQAWSYPARNDGKVVLVQGKNCVDLLVTKLSEMGYKGKKFYAQHLHTRNVFKRGSIPEMTENTYDPMDHIKLSNFDYEEEGDNVHVILPSDGKQRPHYMGTVQNFELLDTETFKALILVAITRQFGKDEGIWPADLDDAYKSHRWIRFNTNPFLA